ncbi:MAG: rRNA-processing protein and EBNA1-binding protein ebp2 [Watsoniomyces obsoletus]|nr:MAG: rRNA-processing protein and EBNA1-binding protein ebp2 [Watsoniomyces obsoletus]
MVKKSKLKAALDAHQGRDYELEKQKKLQKKARKTKEERGGVNVGEDAGKQNGEQGVNREDEVEENVGEDRWEGIGSGNENENAAEQDDRQDEMGGEHTDGDDDDESVDSVGGFDLSRIDETDSESGFDDEDDEDTANDTTNGVPIEEATNGDDVDKDPEDEGEEEDEDIPFSDLSSLSSNAKEDILPHQRLTINNRPALLKSLRSIALPLSKLTFSEHQSITTSSPVQIEDINDDLSRELAFYKQSLESVQAARTSLKAEGNTLFSRPTDYFAEMVKSDEHMGRIKEKMMEEASRKKAGAEARKQRDLKKFGKQVQVAKLQERDRAKRETLGKIEMLKRKRKNAPDDTNEDPNNLFDIALEDPSPKSSHRNPTGAPRGASRGATDGRGNKFKRQKRDEKFGFGGKKRFSKSGDAISSGDLSRLDHSRGGGGGFGGRNSGGAGRGSGSGRGAKNSGVGRGGVKKRLGKSRRTKDH